MLYRSITYFPLCDYTHTICLSIHLLDILVVSLFYGSAIYTYLQPMHSYSESEGKFVALFYTIVTPMINPLIYTLRNKDVKQALEKLKL